MTLEGVDLTATGNGGHGLQVASASAVETFGGYPYGELVVPVGSAAFNNNGGSGISLNRNSHVAFYSPVTLRNNGAKGIEARNGVDVRLSDATFTGNDEEDIDIYLGSRLGWGGDTSSITISCDDSVLTYNGAACP